ncbi:hypothetical protein B0H14DRAFT_2618225 [Mycena olivaceomarginata]|nr:hypothetical protein B0H14DRAFT_2618225 [Mycena olivaceomarginata]
MRSLAFDGRCGNPDDQSGLRHERAKFWLLISTEGGVSKFRRGYDTGTFAKVAVDSPDRSSMIEKDATQTHGWIWLSIAQITRRLGRMAVGCVHNRKKIAHLDFGWYLLIAEKTVGSRWPARINVEPAESLQRKPIHKPPDASGWTKHRKETLQRGKLWFEEDGNGRGITGARAPQLRRGLSRGDGDDVAGALEGDDHFQDYNQRVRNGSLKEGGIG